MAGKSIVEFLSGVPLSEYIGSMQQEAKVEQEKPQEIWALIELFGHQRIAGKLSKDDFGGALFRVDVPAVKGRSPLTKYFNEKAIYALTPVDEATALRMAEDIQPEPVSEYSLRREAERISNGRQLGAGPEDDEY